jgi:hypothetical protein
MSVGGDGSLRRSILHRSAKYEDRREHAVANTSQCPLDLRAIDWPSTARGRKSSSRSPESESWRRPHAQCRASQPSTTWVSKAVGACIVSAMCVVLAACGSSGSVTSNPSGPSAGGSGLSSGQMAKFTQCLRDHGVTIPTSPGNSPPSQSGQISSSLTAAFAACRSLMPAGGPQGAPGGHSVRRGGQDSLDGRTPIARGKQTGRCVDRDLVRYVADA